MSNMADGLGFAPRVKEPESAMEPGMAVQAPRKGKGGPPGVEALDMPDTSYPGAVQAPSPATWVYDFDPATGVSRATYNGEVSFTTGGSSTAGVTSFNTRTGAVALQASDLTALGALLNPSPALTTPTATTPAPGDSSTNVATTAFVAQAITANPIVHSFNGRTGAITLTTSDITSAGGAPLASPALTGTPTTSTGSQGAGGSQVASQAYVENAIAAETVTSWNGRKGAVTLQLSDVTSVGGAPIASPIFTGVPAGTTAAPGTATTQLATTAFVTNAITGATTGVSSFNTRTGAITLTAADVTNAGGAPIVSPTFTGTPTAPTASAGTSTTQLATTAFVGNAIAAQPQGVSTFNGRNGTVTLQLADVTSVGGAPLASPSFSGTVTAPTPTAGDNSTNVATTAFVTASFLPIATASATYLPLTGGAISGALSVGGTFASGAATVTGTLGVSGVFTPSGGIKGVTDGSNAAAGMVGEFMTASASSVAVTNIAVTTAICSVTLTPGDWDVEGFGYMNNGGSQISNLQIYLNNAVSQPVQNAGGQLIIVLSGSGAGFFNTSGTTFPTGSRRFSSSSSQTVYLCIWIGGTYTAGVTAGGMIRARRVR